MGDDAEYYVEQQEEEARFSKHSNMRHLERKEKPVLCWADGVGYEDEIWSWEPLNKILGIFSDLHREKQIGSDCFLARSVPIEGDEEDWDSESDATHEGIVLCRCDADLLSWEVVRQKSSARTLKEKMLAEMLEETASVIEADSQRKYVCFCKRTVRSI